MKKFLNEFKEFALRGNVVDLAVGVIIGGAFNGLVALSFTACSIITEDSEPADGSTYAQATLITTMKPAKLHVAFSMKSVVLRTPIIWLDEAKLDAKPPPFEF